MSPAGRLCIRVMQICKGLDAVRVLSLVLSKGTKVMLSRHPRYWWHGIPVCHRLWYVTSYVVLCYYIRMHQLMFWTHVCFM